MIPLSVPSINGNEWKYIKECLDTNWVSSAGSYVDLFEERFKAFLGAEKAVVTMNGTAALHLALVTLGIKAGDEVIVPSMTFISTVNAVKYVGAVPVFADCCRDTFGLDAERLEALITPKTRAIIPVHLYGHPVDLDPVMDLARKYELCVIEDATESLGSLYKGKHTGTIGHMGCFSFNGNKLITTGAGGMLVTSDETLGKRAKYLSNQTKTGMPNGGFYHEETGFNYRMPNLLAAMGVAQLENMEEYIRCKRENAKLYHERLKNVKGITLPLEKSWAQNVFWLYSVLVEDDYKESRDALIDRLKENGIESRPFFTPVHTMPPYKEYSCGSMEVTMNLAARGLNLPSSVGLTRDEIQKVCDVIAI
ncbi:MAG: LegC family aminotransferase [Clostridia bacterium]|nr:LegC family aminotransferase [Clostridia bacterium]